MLHKLVVAGEGETDMGVCANQQWICTGQDFAPGAVALLLFKLIRQHLPDWNSDNLTAEPAAHLTFIYRAWLKEQSKANKRQVFVGKQVVKGFEVYFRHAVALAEYAKQHDQQMAAYFHDTDKHDWQTLRDAIKAGFRAAEFEQQGLAVVPKPTSEAWFICGVKANPYQHCAQLEAELSGNDRSPERAPKARLGECWDNPDYNRQDLCDLVETLDVTRIDMPSFNNLRDQVKIAIITLCGECRD
ncbi:MAG TPA: hypothetical protein PLE99_04910 [Candidatus Thiothrix moscowensis]|uniref:hypothetical protein n=1 Tax=unclassified Thiothrix TaxID=2636184 RepID=UPI0025E10EE9|nr:MULTISPECIES: hypothetical protein [unclassified Thiothrix]HRJ52087.1 hypothetical protein [Candidatus Thiothrix moscowensis]HRJ92402.1 hypothetical protein [Candidatus Thiothrix moscowensis]